MYFFSDTAGSKMCNVVYVGNWWQYRDNQDEKEIPEWYPEMTQETAEFTAKLAKVTSAFGTARPVSCENCSPSQKAGNY